MTSTLGPDPSHLLSGHATDTLSDSERRRLYQAALDDQAIFDRLVEEESWRRIFSSPGVRDQLLESMDDSSRSGWFARLAGLRRPSMALGAVAAALLAVVLVPRYLELGVTGPTGPGDETPSVVAPGVSPTEDPATPLVPKSYGAPSDGTRSLVPKSVGSEIVNLSYTLELNRPDGPRQLPDGFAFRAGDQFRLRVGVDFTAWAYLFNRAAGDSDYTVLYPHTDAERAPLRVTEEDVSLPAGVWLTMDDTPIDEELVLVVSSEPWSPAKGRETLPAAELEAALARAEDDFADLNWRRSEVDGRVRLEVEQTGEMVAVLRLLGE